MFDAPPVVIAISASDPTSGAGLQADILTLSSMGCHPLAVVPAITIQDTSGVKDVYALDPDWVAEQTRCVLEDSKIAAFKIGLLGSAEIIAVVAEMIDDYPNIPVVLDPVLVSGRGDELASAEMISAMIDLLIPKTTLLTPNSLEARRLSGESDLDRCAGRLLRMGCEYVLITGAHENTPEVVNTLYSREGEVRNDRWARLAGSFHGSGCTLAGACAAALANGMSVPEAVKYAQDFTWRALKHAFRLGAGQAIPDRLFWTIEEDDA
ncbi:MAG: bifunctional hydroxymethylpyrimidine kinase/phosphomethylpyrimidine kinase [Burkholderiales bacterium]